MSADKFRHAMQCQCRKCNEKRKQISNPQNPQETLIRKINSEVLSHMTSYLLQKGMSAVETTAFDIEHNRIFNEVLSKHLKPLEESE